MAFTTEDQQPPSGRNFNKLLNSDLQKMNTQAIYNVIIFKMCRYLSAKIGDFNGRCERSRGKRREEEEEEEASKEGAHSKVTRIEHRT